MKSIVIKPFNVVDNTNLPEVKVELMPTDGDPIEIENEMYYVCQNIFEGITDHAKISVIPLVVRNPSKIQNIESYIKCLSIAHRRVQFRNSKGLCDLENCDEMIIT